MFVREEGGTSRVYELIGDASVKGHFGRMESVLVAREISGAVLLDPRSDMRPVNLVEDDRVSGMRDLVKYLGSEEAKETISKMQEVFLTVLGGRLADEAAKWQAMAGALDYLYVSIWPVTELEIDHIRRACPFGVGGKDYRAVRLTADRFGLEYRVPKADAFPLESWLRGYAAGRNGRHEVLVTSDPWPLDAFLDADDVPRPEWTGVEP